MTEAGDPGVGARAGGWLELTAFQMDVARLFFALPESTGFLLAGEQPWSRSTSRPDLPRISTSSPLRKRDTSRQPATPWRLHPGAGAGAPSGSMTAVCSVGWSSGTVTAQSLVDLAVNAPPDFPASETAAGPTLAPEELAGHKLLALFDRAAARDFADIYVLARRFGKATLLARAAQIDAGFDARVLADMLATLDRFTDDEIPLPGGSSVAELRAFYSTWRSELTA